MVLANDDPGIGDRLAILADAARGLHGETDLGRLLDWSVEATAALAGTTEVAVCIVPPRRDAVWSSHPLATVAFDVLGDPRAHPLLGDPLRAGSPLQAHAPVTPNGSSVGERLARTLLLDDLLIVPVLDREPSLTGMIAVGGRGGRQFADVELASVIAVAAHLGIAFANHAQLAHLAEVEARGKEIVHQLQEAVRPPPPSVPDTELAVHYVAADPWAPTGGDLYDWVVLPDGDLHVAVVDVMGKGVEATKHALLVTHALRLLALEGCPLDELVQRADALVTAQNPDLVATLVAVRYTPSTGRARLVGAGHPPPLLVSSGVAHEITVAGVPIGWPGSGSEEVVELDLERSATLILYTDGLIEARKDIIRGLSELRRAAVATASYPASAMARVLVDRQLADAARQDDSVALAIRRRTPPDQLPIHGLAPFRHTFTPSPAAVPVARHLLRDWLERVPVEVDAVDSLLLVASELCSNAIRHASGAAGSVTMDAWADASSVAIEVGDDGGGERTDDLEALAGGDGGIDELPDPEAERGRGLFLVRELSDEVACRVEDGRTLVRATKHAVVVGA